MKSVGQVYRESLATHIRSGIKENDSIFLLSYTQLNSNKIGELRKQLKQAGARMYVSRNTLARLALKEVEQESLAEKMSGQTAFIWSSADSVAVSKILTNFAKDIDTCDVKGGILEGRALGQADVQRLSDLPPKEVLLSMLLATIQAPLTRFAGALNAKSRDLLSILKQLSEQKGGK